MTDSRSLKAIHAMAIERSKMISQRNTEALLPTPSIVPVTNPQKQRKATRPPLLPTPVEPEPAFITGPPPGLEPVSPQPYLAESNQSTDELLQLLSASAAALPKTEEQEVSEVSTTELMSALLGIEEKEKVGLLLINQCVYFSSPRT